MKNETVPFATTWMDPKSNIWSEISQMEKDNTIWFHLYVESKNKQMNKQKENKLINTKNKQVAAKGGWGGGMSEIGEEG